MTTTANEQRSNPPEGPAAFHGSLDHLRELLEAQRRVLLQRAAECLDDIEVLQTPTATHGQGESEQANSDVEFGMTVALEANTLAALEDVKLALARVDDGTFGVCTACGAPVGIERLRALPQTRYCVACQRRREHRRNARAAT